ncbi:MAG: hypothetical protein Q4G33_03670 [bacterium]|nr:hypothetical protein [bacterium]
MKRIIAYTAAIALAASVIPAAFAENTLDSEDIKELLYKSSIARRDDYEELRGYDYVNLNNRELESIKKLDEIGDASKSFTCYKIASPQAEYNSYDEYRTWQPGDLMKRHDYYNDKIRSLDFFIEDGGGYGSVTVTGENSFYYSTAAESEEGHKNTRGYVNVMDFDKTAQVLNASELTGISGLKLIHCDGYCWLVTAEQGEFVIPLYTRVNKRRENSVQTEWSIMAVSDYWKTELEYWLDLDYATEKWSKQLSELKSPEEFYVHGDEIRETTVLADYTVKEKLFSDTAPELDRYVNLIAELGGVNGCGDGRFYPDNEITAEQINLILNRLFKNDVMYAGDRSGAVNVLDVYNIFSHFCGDWYDSENYEAITLSFRRIFDNLGGVDTSKNVTRGQFVIMLGNILDEHLYTYGIDSHMFGMHGSYSCNTDITIIDYIRGRRLNGVLAESAQEAQALLDRYYSWYYPAAGDILYEYYGDDNTQLIQDMEKYGWVKK